jgi:hypothetical protein
MRSGDRVGGRASSRRPSPPLGYVLFCSAYSINLHYFSPSYVMFVPTPPPLHSSQSLSLRLASPSIGERRVGVSVSPTPLHHILSCSAFFCAMIFYPLILSFSPLQPIPHLSRSRSFHSRLHPLHMTIGYRIFDPFYLPIGSFHSRFTLLPRALHVF